MNDATRSDFYFEVGQTRIDESPFSASTTDNWVARLGGLPPYIRGVTRGVMKSGHGFTDALKIAIGVMHIWAEGRNPWSKDHTGHVTPATQAKATAALAHWEAMKAAAHSGADKREDTEWMDFVPMTDEALAIEFVFRDETVPTFPPPSYIVIESSVRDASWDHKMKLGEKYTSPGDNWHNSDGASPHGTAEQIAQHLKDVHGLAGPHPEDRDEVDKAHVHDHNMNGECGAHEMGKRDDNFVGETESNASGAYNFLPVGPTKKQADDINKTKVKGQHHFIGQNLASCEACGQAASAGIHAMVEDPAANDDPNRQQPGHNVGAGLRFVAGPHPFRSSPAPGVDPKLCSDCGQPKGYLQHNYLNIAMPPEPDQPKVSEAFVVTGKDASWRAVTIESSVAERALAPGQPIPPIPRQVGVIGPKVTAHDRKKSHNANLKHTAMAAQPLGAALSEHYKEQGRATISRMTGKRGKTMLKRAAEERTTAWDEGHRVVQDSVRDELDVLAKEARGDIAEALGIEERATEVKPTGDTKTQPATSTGPAIPPTSATTSPVIGIGTSITSAALLAGSITLTQLAKVLQMTELGVCTALGFSSAVVLGAALAAGTITLEILKMAFPEQVAINSATVETEVEASQTAPQLDPEGIYDQKFWSDKMRTLLEPHLNVAATLASHEVARQIGLPADLDDGDAIGAVREAMTARAGEAARQLTTSMSHKVATQLQEGVANNEDADTIGTRVNGLFNDADAHAKLAAATASHGAYNEAAYVYAQNLPEGTVGARAWVAHHDAKTRETHRLADGQERAMGDNFVVGGAPMRFPGDETAPPSEWINCRCSQAFLKPGESFGTVASAAESYVKAFDKPPAAHSRVKVEASSLSA